MRRPPVGERTVSRRFSTGREVQRANVGKEADVALSLLLHACGDGLLPLLCRTGMPETIPEGAIRWAGPTSSMSRCCVAHSCRW
jgi:hypothetical protein